MRNGFSARVGRLLPTVQITLVVMTILAFLAFVFADNMVAAFQRRAIWGKLQREGLSQAAMRPTPIEGWGLESSVPIEGDLHGSYLTDHALWIADGNGEIIRFDVNERAISERITNGQFISPRGVSQSVNGQLIVADPLRRAVVYLGKDGETSRVLEASLDEFIPIRAIESTDGRLYVLSAGEPMGLFVWPVEQTPRMLFSRGGQVDLRGRGENVYTTGSLIDGLPFAKISPGGLNLLQTARSKRLWALPFWEVPLVGLDIDADGFVTLVDAEGHLFQIDQSGTVILHLPPITGGPGAVRSISAGPTGSLAVVHSEGVRLFELLSLGATVREATILSNQGRYGEATLLWKQAVAEVSDRTVVRRALADAYLNDDEPILAAEQYFLINDREGFDAAIKAVTKRLRQTVMWRTLSILVLATFATWLLNKAWPALAHSSRRD